MSEPHNTPIGDVASSTKSRWRVLITTFGQSKLAHLLAERTAVEVLAAKENAAAGIGMIFDPLDPAAASEKLLHGFFRLLGFIEQQHSGVPRHLDHFAQGYGAPNSSSADALQQI
jgi:hypothetical protein